MHKIYDECRLKGWKIIIYVNDSLKEAIQRPWIQNMEMHVSNVGGQVWYSNLHTFCIENQSNIWAFPGVVPNQNQDEKKKSQRKEYSFYIIKDRFEFSVHETEIKITECLRDQSIKNRSK